LSASLQDVILFIKEYKRTHPSARKEEIQSITQERFDLRRERSVFVGNDFSLRFSESQVSSFSNVVLSLSALKQIDAYRFVVCIIRPSKVEFILANSTFLKKISHSSHQLSETNVRGSFLGHDIRREYDGLENSPPNFDTLFIRHKSFPWEVNLKRLVLETGEIVATGHRFMPTKSQKCLIIDSASLAHTASDLQSYRLAEEKLSFLVSQNKSRILHIAEVDNINIRGNQIEQIITEAVNVHSIDDVSYILPEGMKLYIDIKTKLLDRASAPKAYNIDKILEILAGGSAVISFFFVGIDPEEGNIHTRLVSILDRTIIENTRIQFHWAGRSSRGVTQLSGSLKQIFDQYFVEQIDIAGARSFLTRLIDL
jgi:hypothetical protein